MAAASGLTPETGAYRFLCSLLLGGVLGICYGFLRPLGQRHRTLADLLFLPAAAWVWLYICFALCRGDIRLVYLLGMLMGTLLWERTAGIWLRPVFSAIWKGLRRIFHLFWIPLKKFLDFAKILFASAEKWVTIECTKILKSRKKRRKDTHDPEKHPAQKSEGRGSSRIQHPENRSDCTYRILYRGSDFPAVGSHRDSGSDR